MKRLIQYIVATLLSACSMSCIEEDNFENSPIGNFDALWNIIDQRYCFFSYSEKEFGLDWNTIYHKYRPLIEKSNTGLEQFDIMGNMLRELRDGHVNLTSEYGTTFYWDWKLNHPINFSDSIQRNYLGANFRVNSGIQYTILPDSNAYAYVGSFASNFGNGNISAMMMSISKCRGLILDIRENGGGMLTSAEELASHFTKEKIHTGYIQHKTGTGHNDLSTPEAIHLEPSDGSIWLRPVVVLTNRGVYSSANYFVMLMRELPHVLILGDRTGGGSGLPLNSTLPNGWGVRFSACPILDRQGKITEFGIDPDTIVHITSEDWNRGHDTMIDAADMLINRFYEQLENENKE